MLMRGRPIAANYTTRKNHMFARIRFYLDERVLQVCTPRATFLHIYVNAGGLRSIDERILSASFVLWAVGEFNAGNCVLVGTTEIK
jgi:hypothetical protein